MAEFDIEDIGPTFAAFITEAWETSAENFAADLAIQGANPNALRQLADSWNSYSFEPADYAVRLMAFADQLDAMREELNL